MSDGQITRLHDRVLYQVIGRVAVITLDRLERLNAFDGAMYQGVNAALELFRDDEQLWAAVIQASGERAFCAGADVKALNENAARGINEALGELLLDSQIVTDKPIIAAVQGHCVGEGVNVALCCDIVFADENASFMISEPKIGTNAIDIPIKLAKKIGYSKAFAFLVPGDAKSAQWCHAAGLVETITDVGSVREVALEFAQRICREAAPMAIQAQKHVLWKSVFEDEEIAKQTGKERRLAIRKSEDYAEGRKAFLEKRAPHFTGK